MKVFVTGASGLLGQAVVKLLLSEGHSVLALTRADAHAKQLRELGAETLKGDLTHRARLADHLRPCEAVVHLAGSRVGDTDAAHCRRLDSDGTQILLESIPRDGIKRVVFASSVAVMGDQMGEWVTEALPPEPKTPHGESKMRAERILLDAHKLWRLPVMVLRFGHIYGGNPRPAGLFGTIIEDLQDGKLALPRSVLEAECGLISLSDAANACHAALSNGRPGQVFFIADDKPCTWQEVFDLLAKAHGVPPVKVARGLLGRRRTGQIPIDALSLSVRPRNAKAKSDLGLRLSHRSLAEGLGSVLGAKAGSPS